MSLERPDPQAIVIFGASGDLTQRKAMPALYNLYRQGLLPRDFAVIGFARSPMTTEQFSEQMRQAVAESSSTAFQERRWADLQRHLSYFQGDYSDPESFRKLGRRLEEVDQELGTQGRRLFYCATPPSAFPTIAGNIGKAELAADCRIVIEKPFGHDLASAMDLNSILHCVFQEHQIFRIDHYLGKETVQNILVFRFANGMFEPIWNRGYVSSVQIDVAESVGIGGRGSFYEEAGAVRDIVQNHMMQLLAILTLEPPPSFDSESIRNEKVKLLRSVRPIDPTTLVRGQYTAGVVEGEAVRGYQEEEGVTPGSQTETFAAMRAEIENWRWAGVPFYLRAGKRMPRRATCITMMFHGAPHLLFESSGLDRPDPNHLSIRIQPNEGITITFGAKLPGPDMRVAPVDMDFDYHESFMSQPAEAYERLIHDAMVGDATLFTRADEIERSWEIVEGILGKSDPEPYQAGTWGPRSADELIRPGRWHLC
ncbi:MAG: glucose-6-phosphate dehydrogenase [Actinomycetota bacterium]|nr:glucose-6-phosphate dehydrogenase [Actinomycetota bacterium]